MSNVQVDQVSRCRVRAGNDRYVKKKKDVVRLFLNIQYTNQLLACTSACFS